MKGRPLSWPTLDRLVTGIGGALIVSLLFFPIYLGCAAITAARANPLHLYAQWELSIPFWPFMVVPYLSMFLLFVTPPLQLDAGELRDLVRRLSERHEAREPAPWDMQALPEPYVQSMLNGIVGIEIAVSRLDGKFKLSQNRPAADRPRIIAALERRADPDSQAVAQLMREREPAS